MRKEQIQLGKTYEAKISDKLVAVRIDKEHNAAGWVATNMATNRNVRIRTAGKLRRELKNGETPRADDKRIHVVRPAHGTAKTKEPAKTEVFLGSAQAYKVFLANQGHYKGILLLETHEGYVAFGEEAAYVALKQYCKRRVESLGYSRKKKDIDVAVVAEKHINRAIKALANSGNCVFVATQKVIRDKETGKSKRLMDYEISGVMEAGTDKMLTLQQYQSKRGKAIVEKDKAEARAKRRGRKAKAKEVQTIDLKPGATFKVRSGNEYVIQMVGDVVYAQQLRDGQPTGPTRPFDKASLQAGEPKGTRGEESYYPKSEALDAAETVLTKADGPMTAKGIMLEINRRKLWFTTGRTPHLTLSAAINREIKRKGSESRFIRVERGLYQLRAKANPPATAGKPKTAKKAVKKVTHKTPKTTPKRKK